MKNNDFAVNVKGLTKKFGNFIAVDHIDISIKKGEVFGFLGPNGAGKSTTIKMLTGLLPPSSGEGFVLGYHILNEYEEIKKNLGYMSQKFSLYDDLTVEENIKFFSGIYGISKNKKKERMEWVLSMADLKEKKNAITKTLPLGLKQRLALGCALLHQPPLLFLDEPTSGVDPISRRNFWKLIYEMVKKGTTAFVTTHYMDEADYCDKLALIYKGKIIASGTPKNLREKYISKNILEIEIDRFIEGMDLLQKNGFDAKIFGNTLHITVSDISSDTLKIKSILSSFEIKRIEKVVPSMEDVFVILIEQEDL